MFTGIVQTIGLLNRIEPRAGDARLSISAPHLNFETICPGDSIAVNGVCLTAIAFGASSFEADVSRETLTHTTLGTLAPGARLNLETALTLSTPLGGHLVSGHVDGIGEILASREDARSVRLEIRAPAMLTRYIAPKGSICVDGTSLTVNQIEGAVFSLNIVPHTRAQTIAATYRTGTQVNLEVDLIARYLERLLLRRPTDTAQAKSLTRDFLSKHGFLD